MIFSLRLTRNIDSSLYLFWFFGSNSTMLSGSMLDSQKDCRGQCYGNGFGSDTERKQQSCFKYGPAIPQCTDASFVFKR